jgi:hypothetical protein
MGFGGIPMRLGSFVVVGGCFVVVVFWHCSSCYSGAFLWPIPSPSYHAISLAREQGATGNG